MTNTYDAANRASRERMRQIAESLPDTTLVQPLGNGWSIAGAFAHIAFWDRAVISRWDHWRQTGEFPPGESTWNEIVNAAAGAQWQALPPRWSADDAVYTAGVVDEFIDTLTDEERDAARVTNLGSLLDRSGHRNAHLDDIERSLRQPG